METDTSYLVTGYCFSCLLYTSLYKPATSTTMLSMYLANPAIAGGVAGAILFGLLTIFELDLSLIHILKVRLTL